MSAWSRRGLRIRGAAFLVVTAGIANGIAADLTKAANAQATNKRELHFGIMLDTVPGKGSLMEKFKMIKEAGFEGVEPSSGLDRSKVLKARDASGLLIPSVCCSTHWSKPLSHPDPAVRAEGLEGLKIALRDAKAYGASSVLLVPAVVNADVSYADAYRRSQEEIRKAIPLAGELGVKIALENVWNGFLLSPLEAARYVDELNSPAIGWQFDVGNIINYGWPEQWIVVLGPRIQKLHIKEFSRAKRDKEGLWKGFAVDYLEGDNNWPAVMRALDTVGYHGWAIAEPGWNPPDVEPLVRLQQILVKMKQINSL